MGDPAQYPEIRAARFQYAMQWLPPDLRADYQLRQQWIDNNMSYLDGLALAVLQAQDSDFRRGTWSVYHNLYMCRLGFEAFVLSFRSKNKPAYSGGKNKKDYSRSPPPTTYESQSASSPYPSAAPTPSRSVYPRQTGRTCTYPSNGQGLPADAGATEWNQELWKRARARFYPIARYAAHPVVSKALAFCRPCDASMTKPRTEEVGAGISVWTNENGCAYCAFRPRAPPNTPADEVWKYGNGDGAHNPVTCPPYIRYLCEAGAGGYSSIL
eukprot:scaffold59_cov119-Isochrysis_galbana.AAC.5